MSDDDRDDVEDALGRFGLPAKTIDRAALIDAMEEQIRLEADEAGDQFLMRLLGAQLFSLREVGDSLLIWRAKSCNFDTHCGIDVQFLCGAGLEQTKRFLQRDRGAPATDALEYITRCESTGDFEEFSPEQTLQQAREFYGVVEPGAQN